jgi:hypothetical protein
MQRSPVNFTSSLCAVLCAMVAVLAGCSKPEHRVTLASAEEYEKLLVEEMQKEAGGLAPYADEGDGSIRVNGNVHTRAFAYLLPSATFPPDKFYSSASAALNTWWLRDAMERHYTMKSNGGRLTQFEMQYGSEHSQAVIQCFAYPEGNKTRVRILMVVIE